MMSNFDFSHLSPTVHENRNYEADKVRHLNRYPNLNSSVSGQYGSRNFPKLVQLIREDFKGERVYFVDTRQDTHFELNNRPVSLKRIVGNDNNAGMRGEEVIAKEKAITEFFLGKMVTFVPKPEHGNPWEEAVAHGAIVRDFIENQEWGGRHTFIRFALNEHGPFTDVQVEEFLALLDKVDSERAWLHTNSIVGGAAAILLILMKDICQSASEETLETIISRYEGASKFLEEPKGDDENRQAKLDRAAFIRQFYAFAQTRAQHHQGWSEWKAKL